MDVPSKAQNPMGYGSSLPKLTPNRKRKCRTPLVSADRRDPSEAQLAVPRAEASPACRTVRRTGCRGPPARCGPPDRGRARATATEGEDHQGTCTWKPGWRGPDWKTREPKTDPGVVFFRFHGGSSKQGGRNIEPKRPRAVCPPTRAVVLCDLNVLFVDPLATRRS